MKNILIAVLCSLFLEVSGQDSKEKFDGKKWEAPYALEIPKGWGVERFLIPIEFAPTILYTGVEDIRFTPGWGKKETNEYWSYVFLWYLDGAPEFDSKTIEKNLTAYYTGLIAVNTDKSKIDTAKLIPVKTSVSKKTSDKGDLKTFQGTVHMIDFLTREPITLNLLIHVKSCSRQNKTLVFHQISPKPFEDPVWKDLNQLWANFKCIKE